MYIIDKQVLKNAWEINEEVDFDSVKALLKIQENCKTVFATKAHYELYKQLLGQMNRGDKKAPTGLNSLQLFVYWVKTNKARIIPDDQLKPTQNEDLFEEEDKPFVRLAAMTKALLITTDKTLLSSTNKAGYTATTPSAFLADP